MRRQPHSARMVRFEARLEDPHFLEMFFLLHTIPSLGTFSFWSPWLLEESQLQVQPLYFTETGTQAGSALCLDERESQSTRDHAGINTETRGPQPFSLRSRNEQVNQELNISQASVWCPEWKFGGFAIRQKNKGHPKLNRCLEAVFVVLLHSFFTGTGFQNQSMGS